MDIHKHRTGTGQHARIAYVCPFHAGHDIPNPYNNTVPGVGADGHELGGTCRQRAEIGKHPLTLRSKKSESSQDAK